MGLETQSVSFCVAGIAMFCTGGVGQVAQNGGKIPRFCIVSAIIAESSENGGFSTGWATTTTTTAAKNQKKIKLAIFFDWNILVGIDF